MKLLEYIAWGTVLFLCVGVLEMAVVAAGAALDAWREGKDDQRAGTTDF